MSKIALVTGASRGIGASIAKRLAHDGMTVVVNYSNRVEEADAVVAEIAAAGGKAFAMKADVSSAKSVREMFDAVETQLGKIDVLVNNAGIMPAVKPLAEHDDDTFDRVFAINLKGSFNTMREAATRLNDGGRIVNFSTSVIGLAFPGYAVYAATKSAIETMTNILAKEMRGRSITVNAVAPGPTATDLFLTGKSQETIDKLAKAAPLERLGTPDDIAAAVAFLVGPDGAWINGQTLRANGGIV
ncbi:SDR family oxidoreductase [Paraburkholderia gardini]|uniref:3-oxoacyl-[acyl-carrier-protein] reductase FabG n=1 Tax=Paraburkholderia gardini TaxID=2823469 RepID=A0ABN7QKP1_9BURK|nr:SDR family oxidoreductase [Paraburkholderia gardini]CAG4894350.1 3-oxoacyl-[acyl-carrier-protein] reductase FabG [Paraburkholderia gardini]CAG4912782.1 3-oxoacyl-[acyl-carrier-protein] reductase FabG [Paraburkholderia gardini]